MAKKIKMVLYGEPGVGKSVFASKAPKPFFICTDGNYEWLVDFGAKEEDHIQVNSWEEAKKVFAQPFDGYETIVVDLIEDLFKWDEQEFCKRNKLEHIGDLNYGKGYEITRNEFFLEISKLLAKDKHIILISHGFTNVVKDRRGVEHTIYGPSSRIPDKAWDPLEGRVRYFLRCYLQAEEVETVDGTTLVKKRYLSLIPKENEFGICRGVDESITPHDIPLDFNEFAKAIGLYDKVVKTPSMKKVVEELKKEEKVEDATIISIMGDITPDTEETTEVVEEEPKRRRRRIKTEETEVQVSIDEAFEDAKKSEDVPPFEVEVKEEPKEEKPTSIQQSRADKMAAIKAKLAASALK